MLTGRGLHWLFQRVRGGSFRATYPDGATEQQGDGEPQFTGRLRDDDIFVFLGDGLSMSFEEAYMDGRYDAQALVITLSKEQHLGGFREGTLEVHQILLSSGRPRNLLLTREDIYQAQ